MYKLLRNALFCYTSGTVKHLINVKLHSFETVTDELIKQTDRLMGSAIHCKEISHCNLFKIVIIRSNYKMQVNS